MRRPTLLALLCSLLLLNACAASMAQRKEASAPATRALFEGRFDDAARAADGALKGDRQNPQALLVRALTRYKKQMHQFADDVRVVIVGAVFNRGGINHRYMRQSLEETEQMLVAVEHDLADAADSPWVELELCLACWQVDWNHNQRFDANDERLFQVELDADGNALPDGDPRRKPTFRFDLGDVYWARAMVAFQRAVIEVVLAYRWDELDKILANLRGGEPRIVVRLGDKGLVDKAKASVLAGLDYAERARKEYLAETDDDREWVPNPRQRNHPLPLPVDDALYATWADVVSDVRRLVKGDDGLSVGEVAQLGDHVWAKPPHGFLDIGRLFSDPRDITFDLGDMKNVDVEPDAKLKSVFGVAYVSDMRPSPLLTRLKRMKDEVKRGQDSFARKLRYLLWLN